MRIMLIAAGIVVAVLVIAVGVILAIGSQLPAAHVASRSTKLSRSVDLVYAVASDIEHSPEWRSDLIKVETLEPENGRVRYRETSSNGVITYERLEERPNEKLVTEIVDRDLGYSGTWTIDFAASGGSTIVTVTEHGEVSNILFRFMSRYVFGHTASMDIYLSSLAGKFGEPAVLTDHLSE